MRVTMYRQCLLSKQAGRLTVEQICWLPEKYAVAGKTLRFKDDNWQAAWHVSQAWPLLRREEQLPNPHDDIKHHRRRTGDSN